MHGGGVMVNNGLFALSDIFFYNRTTNITPPFLTTNDLNQIKKFCSGLELFCKSFSSHSHHDCGKVIR